MHKFARYRDFKNGKGKLACNVVADAKAAEQLHAAWCLRHACEQLPYGCPRLRADSIPLGQFTLEGSNDAPFQALSKHLFVDGITGKSYSREILGQRVEWLASALAKNLGWSVNEPSPWDKIDYFVVCWAIHRLNGICLPIHPTSSISEMVSHMETAKCKALFTCQPLLPTAANAASQLSTPLEETYILPVSVHPNDHSSREPCHLRDIEKLILEGSRLDSLPPLSWVEGQAKDQIAFLCSTSGTSGKQKLAMISHYGMIVNLIQVATFESVHSRKPGQAEPLTGVVPLSHVYGLMLGHLSAWRGDPFVVFPRFDIQWMLQAVAQYRVQRLYPVPPVIVALVTNPFLLQLHDLSSVTSIVNGSALLGKSLAERLLALQPNWKIIAAYGLTESATAAAFTSTHDTWAGSSGSILPLFQARLVGAERDDIETLDTPGEILLQSPTLFKGYLGNDEATRDAFDSRGWLRTGDVGMFKKNLNGDGAEHLFVLDRLKELIKVKGEQVIPGDIEGVLRTHPAVADVAVVGVPDDQAGERAMAFVVRAALASDSGCDVAGREDEEELRDEIDDFVQERLEETHWVHDRIIFVSELPKSQNGKVLKRELRARAPAALAAVHRDTDSE
ncbi:hypothetical protein QBC44DRAFT_353478 [Cladorrhinum sp. PSN332]|nr:hypothetical protein QBC44DRAFT_353478 [Cladorrhinum sp. PSN332]